MAGKAKILLVDDDADFVESTKIVLESKPYEAIVAPDGEEDYAWLERKNPI